MRSDKSRHFLFEYRGTEPGERCWLLSKKWGTELSSPSESLSTKLHLRLQIAGHKRVRANSIRRAVVELIRRERLLNQFSKMRRILGDDLEILHFSTMRPIPFRGAARVWVRRLRKEFRLAVTEANRGNCDVSIRAEYVCEDDA